MSIFEIIGVSALFGSLAVLVFLFANIALDIEHWGACAAAIFLLVLAVGPFIGIAINEEQEHLFIAQYEAQKEVIESSLESEVLTGFERVELVKQASELNGQLAEKKVKYDIWHYVTYGDGLYDDVEPIKLK